MLTFLTHVTFCFVFAGVLLKSVSHPEEFYDFAGKWTGKNVLPILLNNTVCLTGGIFPGKDILSVSGTVGVGDGGS